MRLAGHKTGKRIEVEFAFESCRHVIWALHVLFPKNELSGLAALTSAQDRLIFRSGLCGGSLCRLAGEVVLSEHAL